MKFKLSRVIARVEDMERNEQLVILGVFAYAVIVSIAAGYFASNQEQSTTYEEKPKQIQTQSNPAADAKAIDNPLFKSALSLLDESSDTRKEIVSNKSQINIQSGESYIFDGLIYDGKNAPKGIFTVYSVEKHADFGITQGLKKIQGDFTVNVDSKNVLEVIRN